MSPAGATPRAGHARHKSAAKGFVRAEGGCASSRTARRCTKIVVLAGSPHSEVVISNMLEVVRVA
jgi:hypothetical protein